MNERSPNRPVLPVLGLAFASLLVVVVVLAFVDLTGALALLYLTVFVVVILASLLLLAGRRRSVEA